MNDFLKQNKGKFDVFEPKSGHQDRFKQKLQRKLKRGLIVSIFRKTAIAASFLLLAGLGIGMYINSQKPDKNEVIRQNEQYFSMLIRAEMEEVESLETQETKRVFDDALQQIKILEKDYEKLVKSYRENKDKFIIQAMIENFEKRIEILQSVKREIQNVKIMKNEKYRI